MSNFQPPPTWALPVIVDETSGKAVFNPIWLRWFLDFSKNLTPSGTPDPGDVNTTLAATVFAPRPSNEFGLEALETNFQDVLQTRIFAERPVPALQDNYESILTNQVFARRDGTFYAQSMIDNVQGALFNKMFGA